MMSLKLFHFHTRSYLVWFKLFFWFIF